MTDRAALLDALLVDPMRASRVPRAEALALLVDLARVARALELLSVNDALPANSTRAGARARSELVAQALPSADRLLSAKEASKRTGMSTYHFHRVFKQVTGLTPREYAAAHREQRVRAELGRSGSVTEAIFDAGYNSNGRFYDAAPRTLGMQPARFRAGGQGETIRFAVGQCTLGAILVAATARGICTIELGDDPARLLHDFELRFSAATLHGGDDEFEQWVAQVVGFVEQPALGLDLPLDLRGTAFQARVWQALCAIPAGRTASYAEIAARIGAPRSMRAVALACAANPVAVAIPCHRVVRHDGGLSGYRWGVERKRALLARESQRET